MDASKVFLESKCLTYDKLRNFRKYVRRQGTARFLCRYEIFKRQIGIKGSVVECGVHHGGGVMGWAHYSAIFEPYNYHREIIGFDTFEGFQEVTGEDGSGDNSKPGAFAENYDIKEELAQAISVYDKNRFLNNKRKISLIKGDANLTIPE